MTGVKPLRHTHTHTLKQTYNALLPNWQLITPEATGRTTNPFPLFGTFSKICTTGKGWIWTYSPFTPDFSKYECTTWKSLMRQRSELVSTSLHKNHKHKLLTLRGTWIIFPLCNLSKLRWLLWKCLSNNIDYESVRVAGGTMGNWWTATYRTAAHMHSPERARMLGATDIRACHSPATYICDHRLV